MSNYNQKQQEEDDEYGEVSSSSTETSFPYLRREDDDGNDHDEKVQVRSKAAAPAATAGRPPRPRSSSTSSAPNNDNNNSQNQQYHPNHERVTSIGESSILSALTVEPDLIVTTPTKEEARQYDSQDHPGIVPTTSLEQPNLIVESNLGIGTQPDRTTTAAVSGGTTTTTKQQKQVFGRLNIQDILALNPIESEAENAILKAVEQAQQMKRQEQVVAAAAAYQQHNHRRTNTVGSAFLPSIPDDAVQNFTMTEGLFFPFDNTSPTVAGGGGTTNNGIILQPPPPLSLSPPALEQVGGGGGGSNSIVSGTSTTTGPAQQQKQQALRPRLGSTSSAAMSTRRGILQQQQLSPMSMTSKRSLMTGDATKSVAGVSRTSKSGVPNDTRDRLFDVTEQLRDIHTTTIVPNTAAAAAVGAVGDATSPIPTTSQQQYDTTFTIPLPNATEDNNRNAQDFFVRNANMLFRRSSTKRNVLEQQQNDDDVMEHDDDIEYGNITGNHHGLQEIDTGDAGGYGDVPTPKSGNNNKKGKKGRFFGFGSGDIDTSDDNDNNGKKKKKKTTKMSIRKMTHSIKKKSSQAGNNVMENFDYVRDYLKPKASSMWRVTKMAILYIILPALVLSIALFYAGNPRICASIQDDKGATTIIATDENGGSGVSFTKSSSNNTSCATVSWFFIFLFIRQAVTLGLAKCLEVLIIDLLSVRSRRMLKIVGPTLTLLVVQSKGFPFVLLMWSMLDFLLLYGDGKFANHWLFWQDFIPWFNADNPSGDVLTADFYKGLLIAGIIIGVAVAIKRLWMGVYLGKRTYTNYGKELAKVMNDMLLVSIIATIGRDIEIETYQGLPSSPNFKRSKAPQQPMLFQGEWDELDDNGEEESTSVVSLEHEEKKSSRSPINRTPTLSKPKFNTTPSRSFDRGDSNTGNAAVGSGGGGSVESPCATSQSARTSSPRPSPSRTSATVEGPTYNASFSRSKRMKIEQLLGAWEEPARNKEKYKNVTISSILQFRQALEFMDNLYPFSVMFGPASTREECAESSQELYKRLLLRTPDELLLPFSSIALAGLDADEETQRKRLKRLHRMFVPDKDGNLTPLDFIKSVDTVYKSLRMLRASIENSGQIDEAFEKIFNSVFYVVLGCIVLSALGFNPLALFLSLSSIILSFAFMIGSASAKYFEGILLIFARRPYDIGDRIHVSDPSKDCSGDGSPCWFVENVDLFTTTVRFGTTNEVATYSNGSLASMRIINAKRSPLAMRYVRVKFGVDVEYAKVEVFKSTIEAFVKERPREWVALAGFRATRVEADLGYIEYVIVCQHVEGWQNIGPILNSTAQLHQYCLEVSKQLGMRYTAPPLPVHLDLARKDMFLQQLTGMPGNSTLGNDNNGIPAVASKNVDFPVPL